MPSENSVDPVIKKKEGEKDIEEPSYLVFILHMYRSSGKVRRALLTLCPSGKQDQEVGVYVDGDLLFTLYLLVLFDLFSLTNFFFRVILGSQ